MNVIGNHAVVVFVTCDKGSMKSKFKIISHVIKGIRCLGQHFLIFSFVPILAAGGGSKFNIKILDSHVIFVLRKATSTFLSEETK